VRSVISLGYYVGNSAVTPSVTGAKVVSGLWSWRSSVWFTTGPDWLMGPNCVLFSGYLGSFSRGQVIGAPQYTFLVWPESAVTLFTPVAQFCALFIPYVVWCLIRASCDCGKERESNHVPSAVLCNIITVRWTIHVRLRWPLVARGWYVYCECQSVGNRD
jgi:hypothetical protein